MFIRSSTAINDCLIALDCLLALEKEEECKIKIFFKKNVALDGVLRYSYEYQSQEARDKAFDELCSFLNTNYKLRDFT